MIAPLDGEPVQGRMGGRVTAGIRALEMSPVAARAAGNRPFTMVDLPAGLPGKNSRVILQEGLQRVGA